MKKSWIFAAKQLFAGIQHYPVPIILTWLIAGVAAGEVESIPLVAQTGMLLICLPFYTAAAARTWDLGQENIFWFSLSRAGIEVESILIALAMLAIIIIGLVCGMLLGDETGAAMGLTLAALICIAIFTRVWPVFSVPFFFKGSYRWSPAGRGTTWSGPGLDLALKISRLSLAKKRATPAFIIALLVLLLPLSVARFFWGPHFLLNLLFYAVALPYLSMLNLNLTGALLYFDYQQKISRR